MSLATMPARSKRPTYLLNKARARAARFAALGPHVVSSAKAVRASLDRAPKDALWVSYERDLTEALARAVAGPPRPLGSALLVHALTESTLAALAGRFRQLAFAPREGFLPPDELAEVLQAEAAGDLVIGGSVDRASQTVTLWRGSLEPLVVPFSAFEPSGDGAVPDFDKFGVTDGGQTIRLGRYEAAVEAVLYEYDPAYRRRLHKARQQSERSFGAALRRLRKQRGLRREDFAPDLTAKTIARIEQGKVVRVRQKTLDALAKRLRVRPEEIETF